MIEQIKNIFIKSSSPIVLNDIKVPAGIKVLVLAPHPDDFDAVGVTLKRFHNSESSISLAVISGAESGVEDSFMLSVQNKTKAEVREAEQIKSALFFGLSRDEIKFLHLKEDESGDPVEDQTNLQIIKNCIAEASPDIIFLPHSNDTNNGHVRTYSMCKRALKDLKMSLLLFLNRDPKTIEMRNDVYSVFNQEEADWKAELLRHHVSQHQRNFNQRNHGFDERILSVNRKIAEELQGTYSYAEVFEIEECVN